MNQSNIANKPSAKYRPSLTLSQMHHILKLARLEQPSISAASLSLLSTLTPFITKIECRAKVPAYITAGVNDTATATLESLGGNVTPSLEDTVIEEAAKTSKEEYWKLCYTKSLNSPETMSLEEILAAKEYKYLEGLMSNEELREFEAEF